MIVRHNLPLLTQKLFTKHFINVHLCLHRKKANNICEQKTYKLYCNVLQYS